jgi:hypothetical protein
VTFKDLRKIIAENQKLDDDKIAIMRAIMRLKLWPAKSGNGHNKNNNNILTGNGKGGLLSHQKNGRGWQAIQSLMIT